MSELGRLERVIHDLAGPLTVIRGLCSTLERDEPDLARRDHLRLIDAEALRLAAGVAELRSGGASARPGRVVMSDLVRSTARRFGPAAERAGRRMTARVAASAEVEGDAERLRRAVDNLVVNALRHARRDVSVETRVAAGGRCVELLVLDDGPGVDPKERALVFRSGYRGRDRRGSGRGLGLAIARDVAHEYGGSLDLAPSATGACFRITLPLAGHSGGSEIVA